MSEETRTDDPTDADDDRDQETKDADEAMEAIKDDPPKNLEDWPGGKAKYRTYGGEETGTSYDEGPTANLGPADLRRHEDGSITIRGEEVDNPEDYKGEPIPGGPTDPNAPKDLGSDEQAEEAREERRDD